MSACGRRTRYATPAASIIAAMLLAGCAAEHQAAQNGVTAGMLRADGVAVVGVVVVDEVEQVRPPLVEALEQSLLYWRSDIAVTNAARVREQLGAPAYRRILVGFQQTGVLTEADRAELSASLRNVARFLILARIDKDAARILGGASFRTSTKTGTVGSIGAGVSSRTTKVRVVLYDAEVGRIVQSAVYRGSADFNPPGGRPRLPSRYPAPGDVTVRSEPYTPPSTLVDALLEAFHAFANDLPGPVVPPATPQPPTVISR